MAVEKVTLVEDDLSCYRVESVLFFSEFLDRTVVMDLYCPKEAAADGLNILLINDGQDLPGMPFSTMLNDLVASNAITPVLAVGIYCNEDRKLEYGTADVLDFMHRGSRARYYRKFIIRELLPFLHQTYGREGIRELAYAGFSLGGLSALDIAWKYPQTFSKVGVFSGSLWWRVKDLNAGYQEAHDRIMHKLVRDGRYTPGFRFFFQAGLLEENMDRNNNGIIDSIDDTLALIEELVEKGYHKSRDITYLELPEGRHDVATWALAFPEFLKWGWGRH